MRTAVLIFTAVLASQSCAQDSEIPEEYREAVKKSDEIYTASHGMLSEPRDWESNGHKATGRLCGMGSGGKAIIHLEAGKVAEIKISKLSEVDKAYIKQWSSFSRMGPQAQAKWVLDQGAKQQIPVMARKIEALEQTIQMQSKEIAELKGKVSTMRTNFERYGSEFAPDEKELEADRQKALLANKDKLIEEVRKLGNVGRRKSTGRGYAGRRNNSRRGTKKIGRLNKENFEKLKTGMTYDEIVEAIGPATSVVSVSEVVGHKQITLSWSESGNEVNGICTIAFENGKSISMTESLLK